MYNAGINTCRVSNLIIYTQTLKVKFKTVIIMHNRYNAGSYLCHYCLNSKLINELKFLIVHNYRWADTLLWRGSCSNLRGYNNVYYIVSRVDLSIKGWSKAKLPEFKVVVDKYKKKDRWS